MGEKIHGNPENAPQTTKEEKPKKQSDTAQRLGSLATKKTVQR